MGLAPFEHKDKDLHFSYLTVFLNLIGLRLKMTVIFKYTYPVRFVTV